MPAALEGVGYISGYSLRIQITEGRRDVFNSIDGCIIVFVFNSIDDRLLTFIFEYAGCWTKNWTLYNFLFGFILKIHNSHFNNYLKQNLNNDNMNKYLNKFKQILLSSFPKLNEKLIFLAFTLIRIMPKMYIFWFPYTSFFPFLQTKFETTIIISTTLINI